MAIIGFFAGEKPTVIRKITKHPCKKEKQQNERRVKGAIMIQRSINVTEISSLQLGDESKGITASIESIADDYDSTITLLVSAIDSVADTVTEVCVCHSTCSNATELRSALPKVNQTQASNAVLKVVNPNKRRGRLPKQEREEVRSRLLSLLTTHPTFADAPALLATAAGVSESTARRFIDEARKSYLESKQSRCDD
jgi:hypothetical protein